MSLGIGIAIDQGSLLAQNIPFWLSTSRYTAAGAPRPAVIVDYRRDLYALPQLGLELVTNGTFDSNVSGWTASNSAQLTWSNGALTVTNGAAAEGSAVQTIVVTPGKVYALTGTGLAASGGGNAFFTQQILAGSLGLGALWLNQGQQPGNGNINLGITGVAKTSYVLAVDTLLTIRMAVGTSANGASVTVDNISVREVQLGAVGAELVNNANWQMFASGTATATNSPQGTLNLTGDGTNAGIGDESFTTVAGQAYTLICNIATNGAVAQVGTAQGGTQIVGATVLNTGVQTLSFIATGTTTWVRFFRTGTGTAVVSAISLRSWTPNPVLRSAQFSEVHNYTAAGTTSRTYTDNFGKLKNDLPANAPRFTFENGYRQLALNNAVTNSWLQSQDASNAAWQKNQTFAVANADAGPDGKGTTAKVIVNNGSAGGWIFQTMSLTSGTTYTVSEDIKPAGFNSISIQINHNGGSLKYDFTLTGNGSAAFAFNTSGATNVTGAIIPLRNGYYRISMTYTAAATESANVFFITGLTGDGVAGWYMTNGQHEPQGFASSRIPTGATPVTRPIETCEFSPLVEAIIQRPTCSITGRGRHMYDGIDLHIVGFTGTEWALGTKLKASVAYNAVTAISADDLSGTSAVVPFGESWAADAGGSQLAFRGAAGAAASNVPIGSYNRTNVYLARDSSNYQYGDGFYDEVVIYGHKLTSAQLQAQAVAYA